MTPALLDKPVQHLLRLLELHPERRIFVGLAGLPGSGKSTVAQLLAQAVDAVAGQGSMVALGMDGFHLTRATLASFPDPAAALARRGAPWTFDPAALVQALKALRDAPLTQDAGAVSWPGFEHGSGDPVADAITVKPSVKLVLVEGLYLLHRADGWNLEGMLDECWFLDVDLDTALVRLVARHMASWGLTRSQALDRVATNDRLNADIVLQGRARAHWCVASPPPE